MPRNPRPYPARGQVWWNADRTVFAMVYEVGEQVLDYNMPAVRVRYIPWGSMTRSWGKTTWRHGPPAGWEIFKE